MQTKQVRFSKQREIIYEALLNTTIHPTAEILYNSLKKDYPELSLGTVYRNLNFFVQNEKAIKFDAGSGVEHYDATTEPHYHFVCKRCQSVSDIEANYDTNLENKISSMNNLDIDSHSIIFYGTCHNCK